MYRRLTGLVAALVGRRIAGHIFLTLLLAAMALAAKHLVEEAAELRGGDAD